MSRRLDWEKAKRREMPIAPYRPDQPSKKPERQPARHSKATDRQRSLILKLDPGYDRKHLLRLSVQEASAVIYKLLPDAKQKPSEDT